MISLPNVLFVGADKAGSTSIAAIIDDHPNAHVSPAKDVYYFTTEHHRGLNWYRRQFSPRPSHQVVAEVCHDYLYEPQAPGRIARELGEDVTILVCLRDPIDRAVSSWLHRRKHGYPGDFSEAAATLDDVLDHGDYGTHLSRWYETFRKEQIVALLFDDLQRDPASFATGLYERLGLPPHAVSPQALDPRLRATEPRNRLLASMVKRGAVAVRNLGAPRLVGRIKASRAVQVLLYRQIDRRPQLAPVVLSDLRARYAPEVALAARLTGLDLLRAWPRYAGDLSQAEASDRGR
ncbi:MAG TPA: sulfotransferase domain-containing protein [Actinomycetota bacterium]|nr:sulfotransferase domain-containing protein [Actinomycetota bacterium]